VTIEADDEIPLYLTNRQESTQVGLFTYNPAPNMELDLPAQGGNASGAEGKIEGLSLNYSVLANMAGGYPYNQIKVTIQEAELDFDLNLISSRTLFNGLVYQSETSTGTGLLKMVLKDTKYYMDTTAGQPCSEQCFVAFLGDKMCQAVVPDFTVTIDTIVGNDVTLISTPSGPSIKPFLFNKGYFKLNGTSIKIKYWESGLVFQTSEPMPDTWAGLDVLLVAGCDKLRETCRDIYDNEINFSGWGYSMVDYNAQFEDG
jgi:hypothetical protein